MKRISYFFILLGISVCLMVTAGCSKKKHFISDKNYRTQVHEDYLNRTKLAEGRSQALFAGMDTLGVREREAMEFLYAYMPYSDLADYDFAYFLKQVRYAFLAQREMAWGKEVPEDVFRHFVLPYRVNNENLDTARMYMYEVLKERVKGLTMEEAALEVNHWCHEHVAYRGADARTSAPLATMKTSLGRCGEESTFAVAALRSVGIPARQCYTPRWAHCDDNHAWVEVWVYNPETEAGEWKFLGACEPDPKLNMGWFAEPSSRCMMVHTKAFGRYHGDEEVVKGTSSYAELNLLSHYAPVCKATVKVVDGEGKPQGGVEVRFKLYNYAEYYTLATFTTAADGMASLTTGLGDLLVWASDGEKYGYAKLDTRRDSTITLQLNHTVGEEYTDNLDIVPPVASAQLPEVTDEQRTSNQCRIAYEDSLRNAYTATFPTIDYLQTLEGIQYLDKEQQKRLWELVHKSEGNYEEILDFIVKHGWHEEEFDDVYDYLKTFSDKDLRDITAEVLEAHWNFYDGMNGEPYPRAVYQKGILPARISNELVRPWRQPLADALRSENVSSPEQLKAWTIKNIAVDDTGNYYNCPISPMGVFELRHSDAHSRDIFFVAACRSLGVPAYLDNATDEIFVYAADRWNTVTFKQSVSKPQPSQSSLTVTLPSTGGKDAAPQYWSHYTIQRFQDGDFMSLDYEDDSRVAQFPFTLELTPGYYCLSTGNRDEKGSVRSRLQFFELKEGESRSIELILRSLEDDADEAEFAIDPRFEVIADMATVADYAGDKGFVFISLGDYREPSKHLVKELLEHKADLERWGGMVYMLVPEGVPALSWDIPGADISVWRRASDDPLERELTKILQLKEPVTYPILALVKPDGSISYHSVGYKIGTVEQLLRQVTTSR
ncbi:MAG: transglutaminase-like domain-containing protein [Bacteroidales bacterium]|nr:transglutaminase-like domain-containing protein [Bacteroidales bacterium]